MPKPKLAAILLFAAILLTACGARGQERQSFVQSKQLAIVPPGECAMLGINFVVCNSASSIESSVEIRRYSAHFNNWAPVFGSIIQPGKLLHTSGSAAGMILWLTADRSIHVQIEAPLTHEELNKREPLGPPTHPDPIISG